MSLGAMELLLMNIVSSNVGIDCTIEDAKWEYKVSRMAFVRDVELS